jgi:hypothetical protein
MITDSTASEFMFTTETQRSQSNYCFAKTSTPWPLCLERVLRAGGEMKSQEVFCGSCGIWYKLLSPLVPPPWRLDGSVLALSNISWNEKLTKEVMGI